MMYFVPGGCSPAFAFALIEVVVGHQFKQLFEGLLRDATSDPRTDRSWVEISFVVAIDSLTTGNMKTPGICLPTSTGIQCRYQVVIHSRTVGVTDA